jgi:hypothetical protein
MRVAQVAVWLLLIAPAPPAVAQTTLTAGDVAIVGLWCDDLSAAGGSPKTFAFVTLAPLAPGTIVSFTDDGWVSFQASPPAMNFFRLGEGVTNFTVGPGGLPAGSVATLSGDAGTFNLSTTGDQIFAFQGSIDGGSGAVTGTVLWGVNDEGTPGAWQANATTANDSALPPALANFNIALAEHDNYAYSGPLTGDIHALQNALRNPANWTFSDVAQPPFPSGFTITPPVPALGRLGSVLLGVAMLTPLALLWRTRGFRRAAS